MNRRVFNYGIQLAAASLLMTSAVALADQQPNFPVTLTVNGQDAKHSPIYIELDKMPGTNDKGLQIRVINREHEKLALAACVIRTMVTIPNHVPAYRAQLIQWGPGSADQPMSNGLAQKDYTTEYTALEGPAMGGYSDVSFADNTMCLFVDNSGYIKQGDGLVKFEANSQQFQMPVQSNYVSYTMYGVTDRNGSKTVVFNLWNGTPVTDVEGDQVEETMDCTLNTSQKPLNSDLVKQHTEAKVAFNTAYTIQFPDVPKGVEMNFESLYCTNDTLKAVNAKNAEDIRQKEEAEIANLKKENAQLKSQVQTSKPAAPAVKKSVKKADKK